MSLQRKINRRAHDRTPPNFFVRDKSHRVITSGMTREQINRPDKGQLNGACNRTACQAPGANWFNTSTRAYYCRACAVDITNFAKRVDGFHICFPSFGSVEEDAMMKFGQEPRND